MDASPLTTALSKENTNVNTETAAPSIAKTEMPEAPKKRRNRKSRPHTTRPAAAPKKGSIRAGIRGGVVLLDLIDADLLEFSWYLPKCNHPIRVVRTSGLAPRGGANGKRQGVYMRRVIAERMLNRPLEKGERVKSRNDDPLDLRRSNLYLNGPKWTGDGRPLSSIRTAIDW